MLATILLAPVAVAAAPCPQGAPAAKATGGDGVPAAVLDTFPSVVRIYAVMEASAGGRIERQRGAGSGAIISPDGYVVTNHHVAGNTTHLVCNLADHQEVPAKLVGTDALADIAVLKIDVSKLRNPEQPLPVARFGDSDGLRVGDAVYAMGSPAAISQSVTKGIVANDRMIMPNGGGRGAPKLDGEDNGAIVRWIMHDATIFGGNSGGPLMNARGEIIGINEIGFANLSGAIPGNLAQRIVGQLIEHGHVPRSWTGFELQPRIAEAEHGALVASVAEGSPAAAAGLQPGDLLLSVGAVATDCRIAEDLPALNDALMSLPIGTAQPLRFLRGGDERAANLRTVEREPARFRVREVRRLGCTASTLSQAARRRLELGEQRGALVDGVRVSGPAGSAALPLRAGDVVVAVDGSPVESVEQLEQRVDGATGKRTLLAVRRGTEDLLLVVELAEAPERVPPARARRAWLPVRVQVLTDELREALGVEAAGGVRVTAVLGSDPASFPLQVGDVVTSFAGRALKPARAGDQKSFRRLYERRPIGEVVEAEVLRDGAVRAVQLTLQAPPVPESSLAKYRDPVLEFTARDRRTDGRDEGEGDRGVEVIDVQRGGWADLANLARGDRVLRFDGQPIADVAQLERLATGLGERKPASIVVLVRRGRATRFLSIEPVWQ